MADVAIVGAGLAGLTLANRLHQNGLRVVVLESGSEQQKTDTHPFNEVEFGESEYKGALEGRFRCLGGASTRWGGALLPYLDLDLEPHPLGWHTGWGIGPGELEAQRQALERDFGVQPGTYEPNGIDRLSSFIPRMPKWPTFAKRNVANIFAPGLRNSSRLKIWLDATVTSIGLSDGRVRKIEARNLNGHKIAVIAPQIVIAAGAIETTRLLLLFQRAHKNRLFSSKTPLGIGFHDHLSASVADIAPANFDGLTRMFSFRFVPGGMRNLRFELEPSLRSNLGLPSSFFHVAFTRKDGGSFDALRRVFQALQQRRTPVFADFAKIAFDAPWFMRAGWWRFVERRVLPPTGAEYQMHFVIEQQPVPENKITLSDTNFDAFGQPLARIDWRVGEFDQDAFLQGAKLAIDEWNESTLVKLGRAIPREEDQILADLVGSGGIYHPAGTTQIGRDALTGVVDTKLKVHGLPGLWAVATSVFPGIGGSSPSLALMELALRVADAITAEASGPTQGN